MNADRAQYVQSSSGHVTIVVMTLFYNIMALMTFSYYKTRKLMLENLGVASASTIIEFSVFHEHVVNLVSFLSYLAALSVI